MNRRGLSLIEVGVLKSCPFCAGVPTLKDNSEALEGWNPGRFTFAAWVACPCGIQTAGFPSEFEAIEVWNTRTPRRGVR